MEWQPIETAPKDGTPFVIRTVMDDGEEFYQGLAEWRSEWRPALFCQLSGEKYAASYLDTWFMYPGSDKRVPGCPIEWKPQPPEGEG